MSKILEPSLLAFDTKQMKAQLLEVKTAGAEYIHYDVMDGIFVLNTAFGIEWLSLIHDCGLKANVHMMVQDPIQWINDFIKYPVNSLTFHPEVTNKEMVLKAFDILRKHHIKFGIAIKSHIDADTLTDYLSICDYVCIMSVEPGKGGQSFNSNAIENLKKAKKIKDSINSNLTIQLDGGVNINVIKETAIWTDHFISGSFLMKQNDKKLMFDLVKSL